MNRRHALLRTIPFMTICALAAVAASGQDEIRSTSVSTPRGYWTSERMRSARPFPLPLVRVPAGDFQAEAGVPARDYGTGGLDFTSSRLLPEEARLTYPYSTVGKIFFTDAAGDAFVCSGAVISSRIVLTAGHCAFDEVADVFFSDFLFIPAYFEGGAPFGAWSVTVVFVSSVWADGGGVPNAEDFAVLVIDDLDGQKIGDVTGFLGYKLDLLADNHLTMLGYPVNHAGGERMHQVNTGDWFEFGDGTVGYGSDMGGGSSGGPWVQNFGKRAQNQTGGENAQRNRVLGVASFGFEDGAIRAQGSSVLNKGFKKLFASACKQAAGNCRRRGKPGW